MAKVRIKLNYKGVGALLKGKEARQMVTQAAEKIASGAGNGYSTDVRIVGDRVRGEAYTATKEAMEDNMESNTLLRALGGGSWDKEG